MNEKFIFNKVIEKSENIAVLEFSLPETSPYFDGHFPEFHLLPAVAQVELIVRFASEYFGTGIVVSEMRRIKFTNFIRPSAVIVLRLEKNNNKITFKMTSPDSSVVYSFGTLTIPQDGAEK